MYTYDPLLEEDPWVQAYGDRREIEGFAQGFAESFARRFAKSLAASFAERLAESLVKSKIDSIDLIVCTRFPDLRELAASCVEHIHDTAQLDQIMLAMISVSTEREALRFLQSLQNTRA